MYLSPQFQIWVSPEKYIGNDYPGGPTPEDASLKENKQYLVIGLVSDTELDTEALVSLVNEKGEIWFLSNRHLRVTEILNEQQQPIFFVKEKQ